MQPTPTTVMVVDDDAALVASVQASGARRGYCPLVFADPDEAVRAFRERPPHAVVLAVTPPGLRALDALAAFRRMDRDVPVLVVSTAKEPGTVVQAMATGAADVLCKPIDAERLDATLGRLLAERRVRAEVAALRQAIDALPPYGLVGAENGPMARLTRLIERVADTDAAVLLRGEPGTGKERVARAIHAASSRRAGPFIKVGCGSEDPQLLDASLFGTDRGSNGAAVRRPGRLEFANHGTIFLDEVATLSLPIQSRLLHVLQDGHYHRGIGARVPLEARLVSATAQPIEQAVSDGRFREELLFRLNVVEIALPPLRERPEDVDALTDHFLALFAVRHNTPPPRLSVDTRRVLHEHSWPGNVRELEAVVRRLVLVGNEAQVQREVLRARPDRPRSGAVPSAAPAPPPVDGVEPGRSPASLKDIARAAARAAECTAISRMLQRTRWNRKEAAEILGISYKALLYKIKENGLDKSPTS